MPQENWTDIHKVFGEEERYRDLWKNHGFDYQTTKEWREFLGKKFELRDWAFCAWLRDKKDLTIQEIKEQGNLKSLKEEYNKLWTNIHENFSKKRNHYFTYQQDWEGEGLSYQGAKEWIDAGFKLDDPWKVKNWKNQNLTPRENKFQTPLSSKDKSPFNSCLSLSLSLSRKLFKLSWKPY